MNPEISNKLQIKLTEIRKTILGLISFLKK